MRIFATSDNGKEIEIKKTEYVHIQSNASNHWIIQHNMGKVILDAWIEDETGMRIYGQILRSESDENKMVIRFNYAFSGVAILTI